MRKIILGLFFCFIFLSHVESVLSQPVAKMNSDETKVNPFRDVINRLIDKKVSENTVVSKKRTRQDLDERSAKKAKISSPSFTSPSLSSTSSTQDSLGSESTNTSLSSTVNSSKLDLLIEAADSLSDSERSSQTSVKSSLRDQQLRERIIKSQQMIRSLRDQVSNLQILVSLLIKTRNGGSSGHLLPFAPGLSE